MHGTPVFSSLDSHNSLDISMKDDLETLCYTMLFLEGDSFLPWCSKEKEIDVKTYTTYIGKMKTELRDDLNLLSKSGFSYQEGKFPAIDKLKGDKVRILKILELLNIAQNLRFDVLPEYDLYHDFFDKKEKVNKSINSNKNENKSESPT